MLTKNMLYITRFILLLIGYYKLGDHLNDLYSSDVINLLEYTDARLSCDQICSAKEEHTSVIQYLHKTNQIFKTSCIMEATVNGHINILKYIYKVDPWIIYDSQYPMSQIAGSLGNLEIIQFLESVNALVPYHTIINAIAQSKYHVIKYFYDTNVYQSDKLVDDICGAGDIKMLKYLQSIGLNTTISVANIKRAVRADNMEMVEYLIQNIYYGAYDDYVDADDSSNLETLNTTNKWNVSVKIHEDYMVQRKLNCT